jgi:hypothetical protein
MKLVYLVRRTLMTVGALLVLAAGNASAQGIQATIDRTEATVEDQLVLSVTVQGAQRPSPGSIDSRSSLEPQLPPLPDFSVYSRGTSSQVNIINGQYTASIIYTYVLVPKKKGTFSIGPCQVEIDGKVYRSRPFQVRVVAATQRPGEAKDIYITAQLSNRKPYVGEQVIYTWRLFRRVQIADAQLEPQEFNGFLVENLGELREYRSVVGGQQYIVSEIRKALFPQEEGTLQIPASKVSCQIVKRQRSRRGGIFDDFFGRTTTEPKIIRSSPLSVEVKPLPPPPSGYSGLVGSFDLQATLSKRTLKVGESTTLTLTVSGTGNAQMISEPRLPALDRFKIYDDKPGGAIDRSGNRLSGNKSFTKALVPLEPGQLQIPSITLTSFDPSKGTYETSRSPVFTLDVSPAEGREELRLTESLAPSTGKVAVRILADDILPIQRGLDTIATVPISTRPWPLLAGALLAPPFVYLGLLIATRRQRRFEADISLRKRHRAMRQARKILAGLKDLDAGDKLAVAELGSRCLRTYIGDKLGLEGAALTAAEVKQHLAEVGVAEDLVGEVSQLLEQLEAAQYGAATAPADQLGDELRKLLARLERQVKGKIR